MAKGYNLVYNTIAKERGIDMGKIWQKGNAAMQKSMGEDYGFLETNEDIRMAMSMNEAALAEIQKNLKHSFASQMDGRSLKPLAKSVASGLFFKETGNDFPEPVVLKDYTELNAKKAKEKQGKANAVGKNDPLLQKLMPGNLNGKIMAKTGKFTMVFPEDVNVTDTLNGKIGEMAEEIDDVLGNEEFSGKNQRIFISKEIGLDDGKKACAIMFNSFEGGNKSVGMALQNAILDHISAQRSDVEFSNTYAVLNTELRNAEGNYSVPGFEISEYAPRTTHVRKLLGEFDKPGKEAQGEILRENKGATLDTSLMSGGQAGQQASSDYSMG